MKDLEILQDDYDNALSEYCSKEGGTAENRRRVYELGQMINHLQSHHTPSVAPKMETAIQNYPQTYEDFEQLIIDELEDAEKYNAFYKQTGEAGYKTLSNQEKQHAEFFINKALKLQDADKMALSELKKRYDRIR